MYLLFDFDGTLCDSIDEAIAGANGVLSRLKRPLISKSEIRKNGFREIIKKRRVNKLMILIAILYYRKKLASMVDTLDSYPNLNEVLKKLAKKHTLGIITSNSKQNVKAFLRHHKMEKYFPIIESEFSYLGKDKKINAISKRFSVDKKDTLYIGDETRDVMAAKIAGVSSIAVTWGFEGKEVLRKAKPDKIISSPKELLFYY